MDSTAGTHNLEINREINRTILRHAGLSGRLGESNPAQWNLANVAGYVGDKD